MTNLKDFAKGGQAAQAWGKPPRSKVERQAHVRRLLETENKLWIATASEDGSAHLVPFSFVWDGARIVMATRAESPAARNARRTGQARVALGSYSDVVLIDGPVAASAVDALDPRVGEVLSQVSAIDGRRTSGIAYLQLTPCRIQTWWSASELGAPTIMRDGQWVA
jgi:hypothetical protein